MQSHSQGYKLSPQQEHIWLIRQREIENREPSDYSVYCSLNIEGRLAEHALKQALEKLIQRHEILRTKFYRKPGMRIPVQVVGERAKLHWQVEDLSDGTAEQQELRIEQIYNQGPPDDSDDQEDGSVRAVLLRVGENKHALILGFSAMCFDGGSCKNLARELSYFYNPSSNESIPDSPLQYADFSAWQNELLRSALADGTGSAGLNYKSTDLDELKAPYEYPRSVARPAGKGRVNMKLSMESVEEIERVARRLNATPELLLLGCLKALFWKLTGIGEITVWAGYDWREIDNLETALGVYVERTPLRSIIDQNHEIKDLIEQLKQASEGEHESYGFYRDNKKWAAAAAGAIEFEYDDLTEQWESGDLSFKLSYRRVKAGKRKFKVTCLKRERDINVEFDYDAEKYGEWAIEKLGHQYKTIIRNIVKEPAKKLVDLEILDEVEKQRILVEQNIAQLDYPKEKTIIDLFEEEAERSADCIAVNCEGENLSYRKLNETANQVAHYLIGRGVGPETLVGICLERSLEMVVCLLGVLKSGGAYAPLDPTHPAQRLAYQISEINSPVLLTQDNLAEQLPDFEGEILRLDFKARPLDNHSINNPGRVIPAISQAYVIFTSGSTGFPKGVSVTHRNLVNYTAFITGKIQEPGFPDERLRFATVSTIGADLGNTAIFPSLVSGGCLHVVKLDTGADSELFAQYITVNSIDALKIVPSHLSALLSSVSGKGALPGKRLILGGEPLSFKLINTILDLQGTCSILNHYGPTETTIGSLVFQFKDRESLDIFTSTIPIGRPIANTQIYILHKELNPQPFCLPGELYIGGDGLSRGYLNRPDQTAERFIPNLFSNNPGERLYRTGDLVRYLPDGNVEFLGRIDHQIKINGYRIELNEISATLAAHPGVRESVVLLDENQLGRKRLVAFVVADRDPGSIPTELHRFLSDRLPEYMLPAKIIRRDALPLTSNGKVDRKALLGLIDDLESGGARKVTPRTDTERILAEIWSRVLGLEEVGIEENYFELGGDSISSIQVISRANEAGLRLTPRQIFEHQTIAGLAAVAESATDNRPAPEQVTGSMPLTPIQAWFFENEFPEPNHWNQSILLSPRRRLNPSILENVFQRLIKHHDAFRLRFVKTERAWRQFYAPVGGTVPLAVIDLSEASESEKAELIRESTFQLQTGLNLAEGPLLRACLFEMGNGESGRLFITIHHLVVDGVSWRILLEDLMTGYEQSSAGDPVNFTARTASFKQWSYALTEYADSDQVLEELPYWLRIGQSPKRLLPAHSATVENSEGDANTILDDLSVEQTRALLQKASGAYNTRINDLLLAALYLAFEQWTGEKSMLIELEGHGREEINDDVDISRTVGWFTTHYPVLLETPGHLAPMDVIRIVKEQLRAIPNKGIGFGALRFLNKDDSVVMKLRALPQPEISFNYLGQLDSTLPEDCLFTLATEACGQNHSLKARRPRLLQVTGVIAQNRLQMAFSYNRKIHDRCAIEIFARNYMNALRSIIEHCISVKSQGYTPSDFPEARLNQKDLDNILAKVAQNSAHLEI